MIQIEWWSRSSPVMLIQIQWWCPVMIQIEWWSRSNPVMLIQIERWSISNDDVPWWSISRDGPNSKDDNDLKMKMNWRLRRIKMQVMRWSSWYREEDQCWKLCRKNTFLVKRECWCICNFGMYSSMYLMYCNAMFIPECIYYVIDSCFHAPMFWSRESIM